MLAQDTGTHGKWLPAKSCRNCWPKQHLNVRLIIDNKDEDSWA
jgi:hypothetical protein